MLIAPLALLACGDGTAPNETTPTSTSTASSVAGTTPTATGAASESAPEAAGSDVDITIERSRFSVDEIRVAVGTTIVWENLDGYAHTVTSSDDAPVAFDSSGLAEGDRFEFTFDEPGTYPYFCQIHPTMRAVVVVG